MDSRLGGGPHSASSWLATVLRCNAASAYLQRHGAPRDITAFRTSIPVTDYATIQPWIDRVAGGEPDVLFSGRPIGFERTGGSSGGTKLIPYTAAGLRDFQYAIAPWLEAIVSRHAIAGRVYLATSPATRPSEVIAGVPLGLPDGAYLGERWGAWIASRSAVPLDVACETQVDVWRKRTLDALRQAVDLELISVWSPTFLLHLVDDLPDPHLLWPRLRVISCWADASSRRFADELRARLPDTHLQPKGLMSTECVVTVPDADDQPRLNPHGFFEFAGEGRVVLAEEVEKDGTYEVVATTSSGLYRYRTGDLVRCAAVDAGGPVLVFVGRAGIASDLVGEKLTDAFVGSALEGIAGFRFLAPQRSRRGYELVTETDVAVDLAAVEDGLNRNPQYAYARAIGQLRALSHRRVTRLQDRYTAAQVKRGVRIADVKPVSLLPSADWLDQIGEGR